MAERIPAAENSSVGCDQFYGLVLMPTAAAFQNRFQRPYTPMAARGMAYGDYDRDGDLDVLIATNHGPAYLYRNDGGNANHWLSVKLEGTRANRDGIGAVVRVTSAGGTQWQTVHGG